MDGLDGRSHSGDSVGLADIEVDAIDGLVADDELSSWTLPKIELERDGRSWTLPKLVQDGRSWTLRTTNESGSLCGGEICGEMVSASLDDPVKINLKISKD